MGLPACRAIALAWVVACVFFHAANAAEWTGDVDKVGFANPKETVLVRAIANSVRIRRSALMSLQVDVPFKSENVGGTIVIEDVNVTQRLSFYGLRVPSGSSVRVAGGHAAVVIVSRLCLRWVSDAFHHRLSHRRIDRWE